MVLVRRETQLTPGRMYQSPLDRLTEELRRSRISLKNLALSIDTHGVPLNGRSVADIATEVRALADHLESLSEHVADAAEQGRRDTAVDRAWTLVQLRAIGGLERSLFYELSEFCNPVLQEQMAFPGDLRQALSDPDVVLDILDNTVFTFCVDGVFQW